MSSSYSRQRMVQGRTVDMSYLAEAPPPPAVEFDVNCTAAEGQKAIFDMPQLTSDHHFAPLAGGVRWFFLRRRPSRRSLEVRTWRPCVHPVIKAHEIQYLIHSG